MLKAILTEMHANQAFLLATLVATGHLDVNASPERVEVVLTEVRADLEAAGIEAPVKAPDPVVAPVKADPAAPAKA